MYLLKIIILILILCNVPAFALVAFGPLAGTILSYSSFLLIIVYYFLKKEKPIILFSFLLFGLLYFIIGILVKPIEGYSFVTTIIKFFIYTIFVVSLVKDTREIEIPLILIFIPISIIIESIFSSEEINRFGGISLNPNGAGFACIVGYVFNMNNKNNKNKIFGIILFSIGGLLTLSRTFILLWIISNVFYSFKNKSNLVYIIIAFLVLTNLINQLDESVFDLKRLQAFTDLFQGRYNESLDEDSRTETWALYYSRIFESPFVGNGYLSFSGSTYGEGINKVIEVGVHNTYLLLIGESGIFVLCFFLYILIKQLSFCIQSYKYSPLYLQLFSAITIFLLTSHNFFDNYFMLFLLIWIENAMNEINKNLITYNSI